MSQSNQVAARDFGVNSGEPLILLCNLLKTNNFLVLKVIYFYFNFSQGNTIFQLFVAALVVVRFFRSRAMGNLSDLSLNHIFSVADQSKSIYFLKKRCPFPLLEEIDILDEMGNMRYYISGQFC